MAKTTLTEQELRKKLAALIVAGDLELEANSDGQVFINSDFWQWGDGTYHTEPEVPNEGEDDDGNIWDDEDGDEDDEDD